MKFLRNHWYDLGVVPFVLSFIYLIVNWNYISVLERLALLNFMFILLHQFEEYRFPGGEPDIINLASQPSDEGPDDRYPLNQNNAMIINVVATYGCYFMPVLFPNIIFLGFVPVVFGMAQIVVHGIVTPKQIGNKFYTPGLFACYLGMCQ